MCLVREQRLMNECWSSAFFLLLFIQSEIAVHGMVLPLRRKCLFGLWGSSESSRVANEGTQARQEPGSKTEVESMKKCCLLVLCLASPGLLSLHSYVPQGQQPGYSATHCAPTNSISASMDAMQAAGENIHYWSYPVLAPACYNAHLIRKIGSCWNNDIIVMGMINHSLPNQVYSPGGNFVLGTVNLDKGGLIGREMEVGALGRIRGR